MPQETCQPEKQGQQVICVARRIITHIFRHPFYRSGAGCIQEIKPCDPVSVDRPSYALHIILPSAEVPHEVPEIHESQLITEHEREVLTKGRHPQRCCLAGLWISYPHRLPFRANILFILPYMIRRITPHPRENSHKPLVIHPVRFTVGNYIPVTGRIVCGFALYIIGYRSIVVSPVEKRAPAILLTVKIIKQREGVRRIILIYRRICG